VHYEVDARSDYASGGRVNSHAVAIRPATPSAPSRRVAESATEYGTGDDMGGDNG